MYRVKKENLEIYPHEIRLCRTENHFDILSFKYNNNDKFVNIYKIGYNDITEKNFLTGCNIETDILFDIENTSEKKKVKQIILDMFKNFRENDNIYDIKYRNGTAIVLHHDVTLGGEPVDIIQRKVIKEDFNDIPYEYIEKVYSKSDKFLTPPNTNSEALTFENNYKIRTTWDRTRNYKHVLFINKKINDLRQLLLYIHNHKKQLILIVCDTYNYSHTIRNSILCSCIENKVYLIRNVYRSESNYIGDINLNNNVAGPVSVISTERFISKGIRPSAVREYVNLDMRHPDFSYHFKRLNSDPGTYVIVIIHKVDESIVLNFEDYTINPEYHTEEFKQIINLINSNVVNKPVIVKTIYGNVINTLNKSKIFTVSTDEQLDKLVSLFINKMIDINVFKFQGKENEIKEQQAFEEEFNNLKL